MKSQKSYLFLQQELKLLEALSDDQAGETEAQAQGIELHSNTYQIQNAKDKHEFCF